MNAGNVLGTEDNIPARKWLALIRETLNNLPGSSGDCRTPSPVPDPIVELDDDFEGLNREKGSSFFQRRSFQTLSRSMRMTENDNLMSQPRLDRRFSVCDRAMYGYRPSDYDENPNDGRWDCYSDDENGLSDSHFMCSSPVASLEERERHDPGQSKYCLVASKQMVGIFLTVWIKRDLRDAVRNLKVSCVGRGLMGYLGNKVWFSIQEKAFFVSYSKAIVLTV